MSSKGGFINNIALFVKGILMGVANKVPGVSGGAVAYVLGFYGELIYSFQKLNRKAIGLLFKRSFGTFYSYVNGRFILLVIGGVVFSYFTVSKLLDFFLAHYELQVWSLFFGMIIGSGIYLIRKYKDWQTKSYVSLLIGIALGFAINFIEPSSENQNLWFVFLCGAIGVSGMTIPGLSGSYILMLMGNYVFLLVDTVNVIGRIIIDFFSGNFSTLDQPEHANYLIVFLVFTLGSTFGLIFFSQALSYVLNKWDKIVNAVIIGFIIGSLGTVWPWKQKIYANNQGVLGINKFNNKIVVGYDKYFPDLGTYQSWIMVLFILLGITIVLGMERFSKTN